jgi:putative ABC transport system ATP-binding protein
VLVEGESGKGKTTLLHLIAGLLRPESGSVKIGDFDFVGKSEHDLAEFRRRHLGLVFQKLNLIDHLTAAENVALAGGADVDKALDRVGMLKRKDEWVNHMSQGEQQRVAVARVLAAKPALTLADEPTSSLDEKNATFVIKALQEAAAGKTLIVVSHDHRIRPFFKQILRFEELIA